MASRLKLHEELVKILGSDNVYFQPPENIKISYPCIIYSIDGYHTLRADDLLYNHKIEYMVILISTRSDIPLLEQILGLPLCRFNRAYKSDNLYHYVYSIYY